MYRIGEDPSLDVRLNPNSPNGGLSKQAEHGAKAAEYANSFQLCANQGATRPWGFVGLHCLCVAAPGPSAPWLARIQSERHTAKCHAWQPVTIVNPLTICQQGDTAIDISQFVQPPLFWWAYQLSANVPWDSHSSCAVDLVARETTWVIMKLVSWQIGNMTPGLTNVTTQ